MIAQIVEVANDILLTASGLQSFHNLEYLESEAQKTQEALTATLDAVRALVDLATHE